ncbi:MAG: 50S ribosomal protein L6 [Planctomycetes bacterium]|nr:50S ribosomal protein L6 [Planctomycetota bacterium]
MSRIGKKPVPIAGGVKVTPSRQDAGTRVSVEGAKGKLSFDFRPEVAFEVREQDVLVQRVSDTPFAAAYHGTARALLANMIRGVSEGFQKSLEIVGVGYSAKLQGKSLVLQIGFSHPVEFDIPEGLVVETPAPTKVLIRGASKQQVGEFAARIRRSRPPEPYKGKGIRYEGEQVVRKAGKTFGSGE